MRGKARWPGGKQLRGQAASGAGGCRPHVWLVILPLKAARSRGGPASPLWFLCGFPVCVLEESAPREPYKDLQWRLARASNQPRPACPHVAQVRAGARRKPAPVPGVSPWPPAAAPRGRGGHNVPFTRGGTRTPSGRSGFPRVCHGLLARCDGTWSCQTRNSPFCGDWQSCRRSFSRPQLLWQLQFS